MKIPEAVGREEIGTTPKRFAVIAIAAITIFVQVNKLQGFRYYSMCPAGKILNGVQNKRIIIVQWVTISLLTEN